MNDDFLKALGDDVGDDQVLVAGAASKDQILEVKKYADFDLPDEYTHFLEQYGAAIAGPYSVYGVGASEAMGSNEGSVMEVTDRFRRDGWPGVEKALVISMDHAGNAITLDADGIVHRFDHDTGSTTMLAPTFGAFVKRCLDASL